MSCKAVVSGFIDSFSENILVVIHQLEEQIDNLKNENENLVKLNEGQRMNILEAFNHISNLKDKIKSMENDQIAWADLSAKEKQADADAFNQQVEKLESEVEKLESEVEKLESEVGDTTQLKLQLEEYSVVIGQLSEENEDLKAKLSAAEHAKKEAAACSLKMQQKIIDIMNNVNC